MKHRTRAVVALAVAIMTSNGYAEDVQWNGFVNVIGGILKDGIALDASEGKTEPGYFNYDENFRIDQETSFGLQARKGINNDFNITGQVFVDRNIDDYEANITWLYLTYTPTNYSTIRIGRLGAPVYYFSDFLNIGYAYHWVTPPRELYYFDTYVDGVDYIYQDVWKDYAWSVEFFAGQSDQDIVKPEARMKTRDTLGSVFTVSTDDWLTFRAMYFMTHTSLDVDAFNDEAISGIVSENLDEALANSPYPPVLIEAIKASLQQKTEARLADGRFNFENFLTRYGEIAVRAETERWMFMAEYATLHTDEYVYGDLNAWILTGGIHLGQTLYYVSHAVADTEMHADAKEDLAYSMPTDNDLDKSSEYLANQISGAIAAISCRTQNTTSIGVRMAILENAALKFELSYFEDKPTDPIEKLGLGSNMLFRTAINMTF